MGRKKSTEPKISETRDQQKRRYVRLDIFSPVSFSSIIEDKEDNRVHLHPEKKAGVILNLSGGGALISSTDTAVSGELVLMQFDIKGFDTLTDILCRIKRVEDTGDGEWLIGVEFLSPAELDDQDKAKAISRLTANPSGFEEGISRMISRYVFQRQVESGPEK